MKLKNPI